MNTPSKPIIPSYPTRISLAIPLEFSVLLFALLFRVVLGHSLGSLFYVLVTILVFSLAFFEHHAFKLSNFALIMLLSVVAVADLGSIAQTGLSSLLILLSCLLFVLLGELFRLIQPIKLFATPALVVALMAWITWPVFLSQAWTRNGTDALLNRLADYNPLLVLNAIYPELGDWSHRPIAYRSLLNLGQDVPFRLPPSPWPLITSELVGSIVIAIVLIPIRRRRSAIARMGNREIA